MSLMPALNVKPGLFIPCHAVLSCHDTISDLGLGRGLLVTLSASKSSEFLDCVEIFFFFNSSHCSHSNTTAPYKPFHNLVLSSGLLCVNIAQ